MALPPNLLADEAVFDQAQIGASEDLLMAAQTLLEQVQPHLNFDQEDITMFVMDVPSDLPAQYAQVVIAEAPQAKPTAIEYDRTIGVCALVENPIQEYPQLGWGAANALGPIGATKNYLWILEKRRIDIDSPIDWSISKNPTHGVLEEHEGMLVYVPKADYYGPDSVTFLVETDDLKIKVEYFIQVLQGVPGGTEGYDPYQDPEFCPNGEYWRISFAPNDASAPIYNIPYPDQWSGLLAERSKVAVTFADLPAETLGQRLGNTITLDVDAAPNATVYTIPYPNQWSGLLADASKVSETAAWPCR